MAQDRFNGIKHCYHVTHDANACATLVRWSGRCGFALISAFKISTLVNRCSCSDRFYSNFYRFYSNFYVLGVIIYLYGGILYLPAYVT